MTNKNLILLSFVGFVVFFILFWCFFCYLIDCWCCTYCCCYEPDNPRQSHDQEINTRPNQVALRPDGLPTAPVQDQRDRQRRTMRQLRVDLRTYEVPIVTSVTPSATRLEQVDPPPSYEEAVKT